MDFHSRKGDCKKFFFGLFGNFNWKGEDKEMEMMKMYFWSLFGNDGIGRAKWEIFDISDEMLGTIRQVTTTEFVNFWEGTIFPSNCPAIPLQKCFSIFLFYLFILRLDFLFLKMNAFSYRFSFLLMLSVCFFLNLLQVWEALKIYQDNFLYNVTLKTKYMYILRVLIYFYVKCSFLIL